MNENLAWLAQKTKEPKCNKGNFTPPPPPPPHTHTLNASDHESNKSDNPPWSFNFLKVPPHPPPPPFNTCHLLVSSDKRCTAKIEDFGIKNSTEEKLLGVQFDSNLSFESHITSLCKKACQKLHALTRISHYINLNKGRNLMKAFITSQFSYCLLIWMFHSCNLTIRLTRYMNKLLDYFIKII